MEVGRSVKSESVLSQRKWVANFLLFIITSNVGCMKYSPLLFCGVPLSIEHSVSSGFIRTDLVLLYEYGHCL